MATIPFEENNKTVCALWEEYCRMYSQGAVNLKKPVLKRIWNWYITFLNFISFCI